MQTLTQKQIQLITSLKQTKFRKKFQKFVIEGDKLCTEALLHPGTNILMICAKANWLKKNNHLINKNFVFEISDKVLKKISSFKTPNEVLMVLEQFNHENYISAFNKRLCFYLDHIQDPGNMGTIMRTCAWFGLSPLYVSPDCVDIYNSKVVQASMGAIFSVPVVSLEFMELLRQKNANGHILATGTQGTSILDATAPSSGIIVIGNEGKGIREGILDKCNQTVTIPRPPGSRMESLNASVAAGILAHWMTQ